jgi:3-methyladenine DNA glycosylase AlkD
LEISFMPPQSSPEIIAHLHTLANPAHVAGMARYGINPQNTLGISIPALRDIARKVGQDHTLALELWASGIHEARILAALVDEPARVTPEQMDAWAADFDSWDVCDQVCANLFDRTPHAPAKALEWSERSEEFVKRAGFTLMACLAWHNKQAPDALFESFLPAILRESIDERNFVKKAVNWALRQIGKRNRRLNGLAIQAAHAMAQLPGKAPRWIARDALRELADPKTQSRLKD